MILQNASEVWPILTQRLSDGGVFLNVSDNTMTIGWAQYGFLWNRPMLTVFVRPQRHTFGLLNRAGEFTVSIPEAGQMREALRMAGTCSGREISKFEGHGLSARPALTVKAPVVAECPLHIECVVRHYQDLSPAQMDAEIRSRVYPENDFHRMFFGEITKIWRTD